ncbi:MAG: leucine--tRNA ligase [Candidatus Marinimicrobia bacterium]|nr:leucine--tRNA ligase [Candidatus Neomarinimicrobiota bacterium]
MHSRYPFNEIEAKWRKRWAQSKAHSTDMDQPGKKLYSLTMFSYPSGDNLHIGHWYNFSPADTWTRFKKMQGYNTFEPQGFDAFGMPAENYAIKQGVHPARSTAANIATMRRQLDGIGAMYDWSSYVDTSTPEYYKWTQYLFLVLFKMGLAVLEEAPVNWCPSCRTVLANEQVIDGHCERCGTAVTQKELRQWFFKITSYAEQLLAGLEDLDWPQRTKLMQRNWIGRSEGANILFPVAGADDRVIDVFTTRPDTLYGATYMVLAPEHRLVGEITTTEFKEKVAAYQAQSGAQTELERISQGQVKTGEFTGAYALNPVTNRQIPIWIADYVLASYGTGAIMAVPGSDQRDFEFARKFGLEIVEVVSPDGQSHGTDQCYSGTGLALNSGEFSGQTTEKVMAGISKMLEAKGQGKRSVQYRFRDWCVSRQRYWGAPIPIIHCPQCGEVAVPEKDLPVLLPDDIDLAAARGKDISPLATVESFVNTTCPDCGGNARRDTDTMDTFVDSAWYFLRYVDPDFNDGPFNPQRVAAWLPVDMYIGGAEHATMHLLYARFFVMALHDAGLLPFSEPFKTLRHQGIITAGGAKMSKSRGNAVSADSFVEKYGTDVFRSYLMFMGPYDEGGDWSDSGITGLSRFQERVWRLLQLPDSGAEESDQSILRLLHVTIRSVTADLEQLRFNTAISRLMELANGLAGRESLSVQVRELFIQLLAPFMPHLAEELWELAGNHKSVFKSDWPDYDPELCREETVTMGITVNGKRRGELVVARTADEDAVLASAREVTGVKRHLAGKEIVREIVVPGRIVNFVVR